MASVCEVCGKKPSWGMSVSHSHRRTKRRWNPNIQRVRAHGRAARRSASTSAPAASSPARSSRRAEDHTLVQGVVRAYDPVSRTGVVMCDTDLADYDLGPDALDGSVLPHAAPGTAGGVRPRRRGSRHRAAPRLGGRHGHPGSLTFSPVASGTTRPSNRSRVQRRVRSMSGHSGNDKLLDWVDRVGEHPATRLRVLVRRVGRGVRRPVPGARRLGDVHGASTTRSGRTATGPTPIPATSPASRTARSSARVARLTPAPPTTGAIPTEMRAELDAPLHRRDAGPHDVRRAVLDGSARLADRPHRRRSSPTRPMSR